MQTQEPTRELSSPSVSDSPRESAPLETRVGSTDTIGTDTTIGTNTDTITPAVDFINADTANIQKPACQKRRIIADRRLEHAKAAA